MSNIHYVKGDIFTSETQTVVNTVNCEGYMGKGLALAFKQKYPEMFAVYQQECKTKKLRIGRPTLYKQSTPWILNFPTKNTWRANSKIEYLQVGLEYFVENYKKAGIISIAFPKLGAQNGKLSWDDVGPLMVSYLQQLDIDVYIYIAEGDKEYYPDNIELEDSKAKWKQFNEISLQAERLKQELNIHPRDAKRIAARRIEAEFNSLVEVQSVGLYKTTLNTIKDYLTSQQLTTTPLLDAPRHEQVTPKKKGTRKTPQKRSTKKQEQLQNESLFQALFQEAVG